MDATRFAESAIRNLQSEARRLRLLGLDRGLDHDQIDRCICDVLETNNEDNGHSSDGARSGSGRSSDNKLGPSTLFVVVCVLGVLCTTVCILNAYHKPTQAIIFRHTQILIYPFMRLVRLATLPLHAILPQITAWHEDHCLVPNPFYRNPDLKCWPCEGVHMVADLTNDQGYVEAYCRSDIPFVVKELGKTEFTLATFLNFYQANEEALAKGTIHFLSNSDNVESARDAFLEKKDWLSDVKDIHIEWKLQRVWAARVLRTLFPRPYFVSNESEVALQRYIFVDGLQGQPYDLPLTEFANVWLNQKLGERLVTLFPSAQCAGPCSPVSTTLTPGDILSYNWQYWRPKFMSVRGKLSITYAGSYY